MYLELKHIESTRADMTVSIPTTSRSMLDVRIKVDCRNKLGLDVIESLKKGLLDRKFHYAIVLYRGTKEAAVDEKIEDVQKSLELPIPVIATIPMSEREIDAMLLCAIAGEAIEKEDHDRIKVAETKQEIARIYGKVQHTIELFLSDAADEGLVAPEYNLTRKKIVTLLCLPIQPDEKMISAYIFIRGEEERAMTDIDASKKDLRDTKLLTIDGQITIAPFMTRILRIIQQRGKIQSTSEITQKFLLANNDDLRNWLGFLQEIGLVREDDGNYLLNSFDLIKKELSEFDIQEPDDIDEADKYGGTLKNFLAAYNYDEYRGLTEEWCESLKHSLPKHQLRMVKDTLATWMENVSLPFARIKSTLVRLDNIIAEARRNLEISRRVLGYGEDKMREYERKIQELSGVI